MNEQTKRLLMFFLGLVAGLSVWWFSPQTKYQTLTTTEVVLKKQVEEKEKIRYINRTVTVTEPVKEGTKTTVIIEKEGEQETTRKTQDESSQRETKEVNRGMSRYSLTAGIASNTSLTPHYLLGVDARIGNLPLFLGVFGTYPDPVLGLTARWEF